MRAYIQSLIKDIEHVLQRIPANKQDATEVVVVDIGNQNLWSLKWLQSNIVYDIVVRHIGRRYRIKFCKDKLPVKAIEIIGSLKMLKEKYNID